MFWIRTAPPGGRAERPSTDDSDQERTVEEKSHDQMTDDELEDVHGGVTTDIDYDW